MIIFAPPPSDGQSISLNPPRFPPDTFSSVSLSLSLNPSRTTGKSVKKNMFPLWMVTWKFFDGEKARGASTAKCNAFFPSRRYSFCVVVSEVDYISRCVLAAYLPPSPLDAVKVVRSSVTTQDNDKKVRVRLKVGKRWEGVGGGVCVGKGRREREKGEKEEEKRILLEWSGGVPCPFIP